MKPERLQLPLLLGPIGPGQSLPHHVREKSIDIIARMLLQVDAGGAREKEIEGRKALQGKETQNESH
jgi:hypothetical protein